MIDGGAAIGDTNQLTIEIAGTDYSGNAFTDSVRFTLELELKLLVHIFRQ